MEEFNLDENRVNFILSNIDQVISLDAPVNEDNDSFLCDLIPDSGMSVENQAERNYLKYEIRKIIDSTLKDREANIIRMRFGIDDNESKTLDEIGKVLGITRERVRQIEGRALNKIKYKLRGFL